MADHSQLERDLARLRETEITLQQILDNTTTVRVFAKDLDGRYLFVNRAFEQHAGRPRSEIVGRTMAEIAPAGVVEGLRANDRRVIETGRALEAEEANVIRGEPRTMLANKFPLIGADGRPYAVCGISIDITERKRFAEALHRAALAVSSAGGPQVFEGLARSLAEALDVDAVMIAVFAGEDRTRMRTLATWLDGRSLRSYEYDLAKTPCAGVVGREFRFVGQGVQPEFAPGTMFQALGFDSYAAYALNDAAGNQLGLIAALDRGPMANRELTEALLKIFAARAAAELERTRAEEGRKHTDEVLRASEEQYRAIFNATADGLVLRDADFRIVDVNPALLAMTGYSREELVGATRWLFAQPGAEDQMMARARRVLEGTPSHTETEARRKDGTLFDVEVRSVPIQYRGQPHVLAMAREITARRLADEALRASEEQYRAVFNATADALVLRDADNRIVDVNPALLAMTGWSREELVGQQRWAFLPPEQNAEGWELFHRIIAGEPVHHETVGVRKDGTRFDVEVRSVPIQYRGRPHVLAMAREVTARRLADEALRASEAQYRAIFHATADSLVLRDADFRIVDV
ncbi:MAG TPA: PAS domain S-box protein, partial [Burkholderiales bacterium]|nr:PAS domain S-box protein [Burkholderiales bacterium]